jgi:cell division septation protein DedD
MGFNKYINELLFEHNCVIVPGFGGLVTNTEKARINTLTHQIHPACKTIAFNQKLSQNDGLLANHLVRKLNISYDEAMLQIAQYAAHINRELKTKNSYTLPRVGDFFLNRENSIQFVPSADSNHLYASFGMGVISLPGVGANQRNLINAEKQGNGRGRKLQWIASTAAAMLIIAACIFSFKADLFKLNRQIVTLNPFDTILGQNDQTASPSVAPETAAVTISPEISTTVSGEAPKEETASVPVTKPEVNTPEVVENIKPADGRKFYIIGGAFSNRANAERYKIFLSKKGFTADLAGQTRSGLTRVSYEVYPDSLQAATRLEFIKSNDNQSAWLLAQ